MPKMRMWPVCMQTSLQFTLGSAPRITQRVDIENDLGIEDTEMSSLSLSLFTMSTLTRVFCSDTVTMAITDNDGNGEECILIYTACI